MTIRSILNWLNDTFRPVHVEGQQPIDRTAGLANAGQNPMGGAVDFSPTPLPSSQDEGPT